MSSPCVSPPRTAFGLARLRGTARGDFSGHRVDVFAEWKNDLSFPNTQRANQSVLAPLRKVNGVLPLEMRVKNK